MFLGNHPEELSKLVGANKNVGIIMNAADLKRNSQDTSYLASQIECMKEIGLTGEELDLREYFNDNASIKTRLKQYGLIWVAGGNSFVLRRAMKMSGFDIAIKELVADETLVYGGFSAGSCVVTPSLKGIDLVDNSNQVPEGYDTEKVWDGLGFVDFLIAPHYRSDHHESEAIEKVVQYYEDNKMPYKALHDGDVLIMNGTDIRLVK